MFGRRMRVVLALLFVLNEWTYLSLSTEISKFDLISRNLHLNIETLKKHFLFVNCPTCPSIQSSSSDFLTPLYYWHSGELRLLPNKQTAIRLGFNETEGAVEISSTQFNEMKHGSDIPSLVLDPSLQTSKHTAISMKMELERIHLMQGPVLIYSVYKVGDYLNPSFIPYKLPSPAPGGGTKMSLLASHRGRPGQRYNSFVVWYSDILNFNDPNFRKFDLQSNEANITSDKVPINTHDYLKDAEDIRFIETPQLHSDSVVGTSTASGRVSIVYTKITSYKDPVTGYMAMATFHYDPNSHTMEMSTPVKLQTDSEITGGRSMHVEKNWTPFTVDNLLYFVYSICPFHVITIDTLSASNSDTQLMMKTVSKTPCHVDKTDPNHRYFHTHQRRLDRDASGVKLNKTSRNAFDYNTTTQRRLTQDLSTARPAHHHHHRFIWDWGELRGGSTALLIHDKFFLTFFHSRKYTHSDYGIRSWFETYYFGAYTFSTTPPFRMLKISRAPIVLDEWYSGPTVEGNPFLDYVVFPLSSFLANETVRSVSEDGKEEFISTTVVTLSVGRNDKEGWIAKIRLDELLASLVTIHP